MQGNVSNQINIAAQEADKSSGAIDIRNLTDDQFLTLGLPTLVYVRKGMNEGRDVFAIHAANGQMMGIAEDPETVFSAITEHQMVAMTIH